MRCTCMVCVGMYRFSYYDVMDCVGMYGCDMSSYMCLICPLTCALYVLLHACLSYLPWLAALYVLLYACLICPLICMPFIPTLVSRQQPVMLSWSLRWLLLLGYVYGVYVYGMYVYGMYVYGMYVYGM